MPAARTPDISIIVPLYNEVESVAEMVKQVKASLEGAGLKWELICIDDGSRDGTAEKMAELAAKTPEMVPLYLRRNYGQTAALQAGFDAATGAVLVTMDGDLQNDPADIPRLLQTMEKENADIVSGWRKNRKDNTLIRTIPSRMGNWLISRVTDVRLHDYGCTLKAYRREVMEHVRIYGELHRFIPAVISQYGAKVVEIPVKHHPRRFGSSKYGLDKTFRVILDLLAVKFFLKYLHRPMHAFGATGLLCLVPGGLGLAWLVALKLVTGADIGGRPLLLLSVMMVLIGVQLIGMGIIGELLVRIYHEPAGRKQYILRKTPPHSAPPEKREKEKAA